MEGFVETPAGPVPRVATKLSRRDQLGTARARVGIVRSRYKVNPGLYCVGNAGPESPVLVTANYKLSFDTLRKELAGLDGWILVADTRGINVWCAAGKGTFSADEIGLQVLRARLDQVVSHRELILPQLGASGVAVLDLKKKCGFAGIFGPLRAADIRRFLAKNKKADEAMRAVTFSLGERLVLVPVEISLAWKLFAAATVFIFLLSGIGPDIFSLQAAWQRGLTATGATLLAILAGALLTPLLLPWLPGRQFWLKGVQAGGILGLGYILFLKETLWSLPGAGLWLWIVAVSSYMAMNFTGSTPYTSLSGVEAEMRRGLPLQAGATVAALALWLAAPFIG